MYYMSWVKGKTLRVCQSRRKKGLEGKRRVIDDVWFSKKEVWWSDDGVIDSWVLTAPKADSQGIPSFRSDWTLSEM